MPHQRRLYTRLLIVLWGLFAVSSVVAFDTEQRAAESNSCNAQVADSGEATIPPYMEHVITDSASDGYANLPPYSKDSTTSSDGYANLPPYSKDSTASSSTRTASEAPVEAAEIQVPIALAPAAYAAHTELLSVAPDCAETLAPTSTVPITCSRCESTAF